MWTWLRDLPSFWWDRVVASDAGLIRLKSAIRVTAATVLTFAAIDALAAATAFPMAMIVMGIIESLFASVAVRDPSPAKQRLTLLLTPLPAAAALTLGTALSPWLAVSDSGFIVVIFAATYARRFGPRATALGMLAYISYFIGIFLHLPFSQLPYQMLALAIGAAAAYLVRFAIIPDRPERTLKHVLASFYQRMSQLMGEIDAAMVAGAWDDRRRRRLRVRFRQLNETALAAEGQIEALDPDRLTPASRRSELGLRLFDLEVAAGILADAAVRALPPPPERAPLRRALGALRDTLDNQPASLPEAVGPDMPGTEGLVARGIGNLAKTLRAMPAAESANKSASTEQPAGADGPAPDAGDSRMRPTTRAAIQVTVACMLAIVPGEFLSAQRWYWAVITVFVMFTGTQSRGDVLAKGVQRAAGTLAGVAAGIVVATAVSGNYPASLGLIFVCVFLGFYLLQVAYGLMIFWITILISLLYGLLGFFTPALLVLRIEETAIGAVIGVLVAMLLLPTSSRATFNAASRAFLQTLDDLVGRAVRPGGEDLTESARELDRRFHQVRTAARPLTGGISGALAPSGARRAIRVFQACDNYARALASFGGREFAAAAPPEAEECRIRAARIHANIDRIRAALDKTRTMPATAATGDPENVHASGGAASDDRGRSMLRALAGIDEVIRLLARYLGVARGAVDR